MNKGHWGIALFLLGYFSCIFISSIEAKSNFIKLTRSELLNLNCGAGDSTTVQTSSGCIKGVISSEVEGYLGIPYAKPPIGSLRFKRTQPVKPWTGVYDGTKLKAACTQFAPPGGNTMPGFSLSSLPGQSEDCLTMNIWKPVNGTNLPILFFIHGGTYVSDSGALPVYNKFPNLAKNAIVVNINYRLGPLGLLAHPALSDQDPNGVSGNLTIWDALEALKWIKENAEAFGGDPNKIMIYGQSSGAAIVLSLLQIPKQIIDVTDLFSSAVIQSGPFFHTSSTLMESSKPDEGENFGLLYAKQLGCNSGTNTNVTSCLQQKPVADLISAWRALVKDGAGPNGGSVSALLQDGYLLPDKLSTLFKTGNFARVPIVVGTMANEFGGIYTLGINNWNDFDSKITEAATKLGISNLSGLKNLYRSAYPTEPGLAYEYFKTDSEFACGTDAFLKTISQYTTTRGYYNKQIPSFSYLPMLKAYHATDLYYIFGSSELQFSFTEPEKNFMRYMGRNWTSIANGQPTISKTAETQISWNQIGNSQYAIFSSNENKMAVNPRKTFCDFLQGQGIYLNK